jgi:hypothetical protein
MTLIKRISFLILANVAALGCAVTCVFSQSNVIEVSGDEFGGVCYLGNDSGPGLRTVYVRQSPNFGATASRFRLALSPGATMTYISEVPSFSSLGNTQDGITLCYGSCVDDFGFLLVAVTFQSFANDQNCSQVMILPHPSSESIEVINCLGQPEIAYGKNLFILAPGGICGCPVAHLVPGTPQVFGCAPVPVEETTWGRVKALYR